MACTKERASLINEFAIGRLSPEKADELLDHVSTCDECSARLDMVAGILACKEEYGAEVFEGEPSLSSAYWIRIKDGLRAVFTSRPLLRVAIPVAVALVTAFLLFNPFSQRVGDYARLAHIEPYPYKPLSLRAGEDYDDYEVLFHEGMKLYVEEKYGEAIRKLAGSVKLNPDNAEAQFYLGVCYLLENKSGNAIEPLQRAAELGSRPVIEKSHWYLGQTYLKKNEGERAEEEFKKVIEFNGRLRGNAEEMIEKMGKIRGER